MLVTVIIPTYNWSEALRVSIASVLAQTYRDFELLVIGDCCTDDSEEAALSFGDPRVRWHNLPARHKSQSGPNNYGIATAAGSLIAYLGHDDVWHPGHLRSLVTILGETGAEMACAVTVMYGPPGSGIRGLAGIFVEGRDGRGDFVPPSSLMHQRALAERIGPWRSPEQLAIPVDCDYLQRARESGARLVSTERLTVFKFNSAWRRDSYLHCDAGEGKQMLARLKSGPAKCVEEEWAALMRAMREKRLIEMRMPSAEEAAGAPGGQHRANLRRRGLEEVEIAELAQTRRFLLEDQASALDWHAVEYHGTWGPFRWSGPSPAAGLTLPVQTPPRFRLRMQVLNWLQVNVVEELTILVANRRVDFTSHGDGKPGLTVEAVVSLPEAQAGPLRIQLKAARLRCPFFETGGASPDQRWLGVCVGWVEVEPLAPEGAGSIPASGEGL